MQRQLLRTRILGIISLVAVFAACWFVLIRPVMDRPDQIAAKQVEAQNQYAQATAQIEALKKAQKNIGAVKKDAKKLTNKFPSTVDPTAISASVYAAAERSGIPASAVVGVDVGQAGPYQPGQSNGTASPTPAPSSSTSGNNQNTIMQMGVKITINAPIGRTGAFAKQLTSGARMFTISSITTSSAAGGSSGQTVIEAKTYLLPPLPAAPSK